MKTLKLSKNYIIKRFFIKLYHDIQFPFIQLCNYFLVKRYPFLKPSCGWDTNMIYNSPSYKYRYQDTWIDCVPRGWRKIVFSMCKELKRAIKELEHPEDYKIHQVKEKFGKLCWYTEGGNQNTRDIEQKYENLSTHICINCGKPATKTTAGWITYVCNDCYEKIEKRKKKYGY